MARYAEAHGCRMVGLVRHFGDQEDSGEACALCDACAPGKCYVRRFRTPTSASWRAKRSSPNSRPHGRRRPTTAAIR